MILQALVALPVTVAVLLAAGGRWLPRSVVDAAATATVVVVAVLAAMALAGASTGSPEVIWLGGWKPETGVGLPLVADAFAAGLALVVAVLTLAALMFSWRFFTEVHAIFHTLMLLFLAAMCAFAFTGDLFDAFVFFELMSVVAFVLAGYRSEEPATVHGALNFGIVNSLGAYLTLAGIGVIYARTGQLGFATLGQAMPTHDDALVTAAFVLICTGFLVKAAVVPFHFWLADAHAVAPTPVCVLFSGIMVELGVYAVARTYWTMFEGLVPLRGLAVLGVATALLGGVMCLMQRHVKRLLACSTISHVGLMATAVAMADPRALTGTALYLVGHAGVKGALFLGAGALLNRFETVDEHELHGRGKNMRVTSMVFLLGGLGLAGPPRSPRRSLLAPFCGSGHVSSREPGIARPTSKPRSTRTRRLSRTHRCGTCRGRCSRRAWCCCSPPLALASYRAEGSLLPRSPSPIPAPTPRSSCAAPHRPSAPSHRTYGRPAPCSPPRCRSASPCSSRCWGCAATGVPDPSGRSRRGCTICTRATSATTPPGSRSESPPSPS